MKEVEHSISLLDGLNPSLLLQEDEVLSVGRAEVALPIEDEGPRLEVLQPPESIQIDADWQLLQFFALSCEVLDHLEAGVVCF